VVRTGQPARRAGLLTATGLYLTTFAELELSPALCRALAAEDYSRPTPIQVQAIPPLLDGKDVLGCAQTGTGKTAAFALPVLAHLEDDGPQKGKKRVRALVLTPTRELAAQVGESFDTYGRFLPFDSLVIFGGVNEKSQIAALRRGVDILVATPGRLLDLHGRGFVDFSDIEFFILDEADRMLDMGFVNDVKRVLRELPKHRQNLLFSATMPPPIVSLAGSFLKDPVKVEVTPQSTTVERIDQTVMFVDRPDKKRLLRSLLSDRDIERTIVFTRTKHGANRLATFLDKGGITCAAIHGNKTQNARRRALDGFRAGNITALIATDIASRGIDIDDVSHVFNFDLPNEPESYVHRIGRTGRAGRSGVAVSFCDPTEGEYLRDIEKLIGMDIPVVDDHDFHCAAAVPPPRAAKSANSATSGRSAKKPGTGRPSRRRPRGGRRGGANAGRTSGSGSTTSRESAARPARDASRPSGGGQAKPAGATQKPAGSRRRRSSRGGGGPRR